MNSDRKAATPTNLVGLMPAGGRATRLAPLPCSKELFPVGFRPDGQTGDLRPKVVCHYLLEKMQSAGVQTVYVIIRKQKWDIPAYLADGAMLDLHLAYLILNLPFGVPYTLDQAYPFVKNSTVVFGFPDIFFKPEDAFVHLLRRLEESGAEMVLGLFPAANPGKMDMVDLDDTGGIREIQIKPAKTRLRYTWIIAVWTPTFTDFMHRHVLADLKARERNSGKIASEKSPELFMSHVIRRALQTNMPIDTLTFSEGNCIDIGTSEDLLNVLKTTLS